MVSVQNLAFFIRLGSPAEISLQESRCGAMSAAGQQEPPQSGGGEQASSRKPGANEAASRLGVGSSREAAATSAGRGAALGPAGRPIERPPPPPGLSAAGSSRSVSRAGRMCGGIDVRGGRGEPPAPPVGERKPPPKDRAAPTPRLPACHCRCPPPPLPLMPGPLPGSPAVPCPCQPRRAAPGTSASAHLRPRRPRE